MSTQFSIYYNSRENQEYLRQVIEASGMGKLVESHDLAHLPPQSVNGNDVVFLEYQENNPELDHWIEGIAANPKSPAIFLYFKEISTNNLWKAIRLGAKECFTFPIQAEDFQEAVKRTWARIEVRKGMAKPTQVISFLGCKGGVGTSLLAANLARLLAQERHGKVLIVDLDLGFGQLNYFFDVHPEHTVVEVIENIDRLDDTYLRTIFCPIGDNCYLLAAPGRLEEAEAINAGHLEKIIGYLKENLGFRWILIDCCHQLDEITMKALELSESLVLVTAQSIPAISNAKKMLDILTVLDLRELEVEVWVNYWDRQHELTTADVETFLGKAVAGTISCDYKQASFSVNEGKLLVETSPRHPIALDLKSMAGKISREDTPEETNGAGWKWLQRLWSKKKS
jgi:pilus assembly protein CpaE